MKIKTLSIILFLLTVNSINAQSIYEQWPAIKSFHEVISQTFHPAEEGNLEPVKTRSEELMNKAAYILMADIPEEYRTKSILDALDKLQLESKLLNQLVVSKASDLEILKSITAVHDTFHKIIGFCINE